MSLDDFNDESVDLQALVRTGGDDQVGGTASVSRVWFGDAEWAYKEYKAKDREQLDVALLQKIISWRSGLSQTDRACLDAFAAWPRCPVHDDEGVAGVLLPLAPAPFVHESLPSTFKPRELAWVTMPFKEGRPYYEVPEKLARLGHLGGVMSFLHEHGVVIGDLQPKNALTTGPGAEPATLLIDCDSVVLDGASALPQIDPGHYKLPIPRPFDRESDYWKLAVRRSLLAGREHSLGLQRRPGPPRHAVR